jgi:serine phosphatase RsbU (regulator of sigma subunit)
MKFDYAIGNPPYQRMDGAGVQGGQAIYHMFCENADRMTDQWIFIIPTRWMTDTPRGVSVDWMKKMRSRTDYLNIIEYVDGRISEKNEAGMFVTLWLGIIDLKNGKVEVSNAGHEFPAIRKNGADFTIEKTQHGMPVAFFPGSKFNEFSMDIHPGDRIFLFTDGVTDAEGSKGKRFGTENMLRVLNENKDSSDEELVLNMLEEINKFVGKRPQFDDITMLSFTYKG